MNEEACLDPSHVYLKHVFVHRNNKYAAYLKAVQYSHSMAMIPTNIFRAFPRARVPFEYYAVKDTPVLNTMYIQ